MASFSDRRSVIIGLLAVTTSVAAWAQGLLRSDGTPLGTGSMPADVSSGRASSGFVGSGYTPSTPTLISFGTRNGHPIDPGSARYLNGPVLTNLFGNGIAGAAGALAVRVRFNPGELFTLPYAPQPNRVAPVLGTNSTNGGGTTYIGYCGPLSSVTANRDRFQIIIKDGAASSHTVTLTSGLASSLIDATGVLSCVVLIRRDSTGAFTVTLIDNNGATVVGTSVTPTAWVGRASQPNPLSIGHALGGRSIPALSLANYFPGSVVDLVQLDGISGTDAEWQSFAKGGDPGGLWGSKLAAHFSLKNPGDLAQTAGSRSYAALALGGTGHTTSHSGKMVRSADGSKGLGYAPVFQGYTHALDPVALRACTSLSDLQALTGVVSRDALVDGPVTHLEARALRKSDGLVLKDWTRCTASPASGLVPILLPGVPCWMSDKPAEAAELILELRREDDPSFVAQMLDDDRVGIVAAMGPGQSQMEIAYTGSAAGRSSPADPYDLVPNPNSSVTFCASRGAASFTSPNDGGYIRNRFIVSNAVVAMAQYWDSLATGIALEFVKFNLSGTSTIEWMYHANKQSSVACKDMWGDNGNQASGYVTASLLAKRKRVSLFLSSWHTADRSKAFGGPVTLSTIYGTRSITELP